MIFTKTFEEPVYRRALEDWGWLPIAGKRPVLASLFGDVFLEDDAGVWCLDVLEGGLGEVFDDRGQMMLMLATQEGQDEHLLAGFAIGARERRGLVPGPSEVLAWSVPPVLGGPLEVENLEVMDFVVYMSIQGQLNRQVSQMKPGTKISGFFLEGEDSVAPPRKKGWFRRT